MAFGAIFKENRRHLFAECNGPRRALFGCVIGIATGDEYQPSGETESDGNAQGETSSAFHRIRSFSGMDVGCLCFALATKFSCDRTANLNLITNAVKPICPSFSSICE